MTRAVFCATAVARPRVSGHTRAAHISGEFFILLVVIFPPGAVVMLGPTTLFADA